MDIEAIRKQVEQQVMQYFHLEPTVTDAPYAGMVTGVDVISHLEHSLLNPDTTLETIERECAVARKYSVAAKPYQLFSIAFRSSSVACAVSGVTRTPSVT